MRQPAARVEPQPGGGVIETWWLPGDRLEPVNVPVEPCEALQKAGGVWVPRRLEDREDVADLDNPARVHDDDAIGELCDQAEVVCDEDDRRLRLALRGLQHLDDLRLDRHIERRRRLVCDEDAGIVRDRHRDHRALTHAARELVRVLVVPLLRGRDTDELQQRHRALRAVASLESGLWTLMASEI